jgi:hypothetical protein
MDTQMTEAGGLKHDQEKVQLELLSPTWLYGVGRVLTFGAKKYAAHNWRKGIQLSRLLGAALRHILSFLGGEDTDPESGLSHLYHASCCLMFASELHQTRPELDDRYKGESKKESGPEPEPKRCGCGAQIIREYGPFLGKDILYVEMCLSCQKSKQYKADTLHPAEKALMDILREEVIGTGKSKDLLVAAMKNIAHEYFEGEK